MTDEEVKTLVGRREEIARLIGSFVVVDDKGGPDTIVLQDVIGGDYDESVGRVYALTDAIISLFHVGREEEEDGSSRGRADRGSTGGVVAQRPASWLDLWPVACEYVHHIDDCAGFHSSDKCTCGAVAFLDALAAAPAPKRTVDLSRSEIAAISRQCGDA